MPASTPRAPTVGAGGCRCDPGAPDTTRAGAKAADPLASLVKATSAPAAAPANIGRPPALVPASSRNETIANPSPGSRRAAAGQRALTEYGYAQLKPAGTVGSDTQAALQKF